MKMRFSCLISLALATSNGFADSYTINLPSGWCMIANHLDSSLPSGNKLDKVLPNVPPDTE
jgi:hypothetical protein